MSFFDWTVLFCFLEKMRRYFSFDHCCQVFGVRLQQDFFKFFDFKFVFSFLCNLLTSDPIHSFYYFSENSMLNGCILPSRIFSSNVDSFISTTYWISNFRRYKVCDLFCIKHYSPWYYMLISCSLFSALYKTSYMEYLTLLLHYIVFSQISLVK